jgi:hypothetical protein
MVHHAAPAALTCGAGLQRRGAPPPSSLMSPGEQAPSSWPAAGRVTPWQTWHGFHRRSCRSVPSGCTRKPGILPDAAASALSLCLGDVEFFEHALLAALRPVATRDARVCGLSRIQMQPPRPQAQRWPCCPAKGSASVGSLVGVATESVTGIDSDAPQYGCDFVVKEAAHVNPGPRDARSRRVRYLLGRRGDEPRGGAPRSPDRLVRDEGARTVAAQDRSRRADSRAAGSRAPGVWLSRPLR